MPESSRYVILLKKHKRMSKARVIRAFFPGTMALSNDAQTGFSRRGCILLACLANGESSNRELACK